MSSIGFYLRILSVSFNASLDGFILIHRNQNERRCIAFKNGREYQSGFPTKRKQKAYQKNNRIENSK